MKTFFADQYYKAPTDQVFEGVKSAALKILTTHPNPLDDRSRIAATQNCKDSACMLVELFDKEDQKEFLLHTGGDARDWVEYYLFCTNVLNEVGGRYIIKDLNYRILTIETQLKDLKTLLTKIRMN